MKELSYVCGRAVTVRGTGSWQCKRSLPETKKAVVVVITYVKIGWEIRHGT